MMTNLFKKVSVFSDIHFGKSNNLSIHNQDCIRFVNWFIKESINNNCETCIFMGDYLHNRATTNNDTLNYAVKAIRLLSKNFKNVYMITGNHDLFYRENRDINSFPYADIHDNVHIIDEIFIKDNVAITPWLVGNEWKNIRKIETKYLFGHFEIPSFEMNNNIEMPDDNKIKSNHFKNIEHVFSGHFHKRQTKNNITYIGNPFPHNYADVDDKDRGMMILEWGKDFEFINWKDGPQYKVIYLSDLIDNFNKNLGKNLYLRIFIDIEISYKELIYLKETITKKYKPRDIQIIEDQNIYIKDETCSDNNIKIENIDESIINFINNIDGNELDKSLLINVYRDIESFE